MFNSAKETYDFYYGKQKERIEEYSKEICTEGMSLIGKRCVILEIENKVDFENKMNEHLTKGYKIEASSCNSKYYKAILVLGE